MPSTPWLLVGTKTDLRPDAAADSVVDDDKAAASSTNEASKEMVAASEAMLAASEEVATVSAASAVASDLAHAAKKGNGVGSFISEAQGKAQADMLKAAKYVECSSLLLSRIDEVFIEATKAAAAAAAEERAAQKQIKKCRLL